MPYKEHILFTDPEETTILWRYMDFTKFVSLLDSKSLFFPSAKKLQKIDPWEGSELKNELDYDLRNELRIWNKSKNDNQNIIQSDFEHLKECAKGWENGYEHQCNINFISCWHYNQTESAAMWRLYLKSNEGLCIRTDIESFKKSFHNSKENIFIGKVRYKDYENDIYYSDYDMSKVGFAGANMFLPFIHKRKIYEHEKEYRAIAFIIDDSWKDKNGILVNVDLNVLIKEIIVAPSSQKWFKDIIQSIILKYGYDFKLSNSIVDDTPYSYDLSVYANK
ncbi:MAG: DUF2971 domain-containing protein [Ignavibacteria bacterium]